MKKLFFLLLTTSLCLLCACGDIHPGSGLESDSGTPSSSGADADADLFPDDAATLRCRVIQSSTDSLLLAGEREYDIYQVTTADLCEDIPIGSMVDVSFTGGILEVYPAILGDVIQITVLPEECNDLCALYLSVLEHLWAVDPTINPASDAETDGFATLAVDLSQTSLTRSEQNAVAWQFGSSHNLDIVECKIEDMQTSSAEQTLHCFSISETQADQASITFTAEKSAYKAGQMDFYILSDCTTGQDNTGHWDGFEIGSEIIT